MLVAGCTGLPDSGEKGYVTGDGLVRQVAASERVEPIELSGRDLAGGDLALDRGTPQVLVVWGSWCVECRQEQDEVNAAARELAGTADFLGLNVRENSVENARSYEREFNVPYPSIDAADGKALLAFNGVLSFSTVPAFVILDGQGRVAASILGRLPSTTTLVQIVEEVAAEAETADDAAVRSGPDG